MVLGDRRHPATTLPAGAQGGLPGSLSCPCWAPSATRARLPKDAALCLGSLHVLLQLLLVQGLEPADHSLVDSL